MQAYLAVVRVNVLLRKGRGRRATRKGGREDGRRGVEALVSHVFNPTFTTADVYMKG